MSVYNLSAIMCKAWLIHRTQTNERTTHEYEKSKKTTLSNYRADND